MKTFYIQSYYQYPVTFSSIGKTIPARSAQGELRNCAEFTEKEIDILENREPFFRELVNTKKIRVLNHLPNSYVPPAQQINNAQNEAAQAKAEADRLRKELEEAKTKLAALEGGKAEATTEESSEVVTTSLEATSYEGLKEIAKTLGIEFKANVKKADLIKMIKEVEAKAE